MGNINYKEMRIRQKCTYRNIQQCSERDRKAKYGRAWDLAIVMSIILSGGNLSSFVLIIEGDFHFPPYRTGLRSESGVNSSSFSFNRLTRCSTKLVGESLSSNGPQFYQRVGQCIQRPPLSEMSLLSCFFLDLPVFGWTVLRFQRG